MNAVLDIVAPDTACTFALCALSASVRRIGPACELICAERGRSL